jgi:NCAIR mutase (PurE)-related protein
MTQATWETHVVLEAGLANLPAVSRLKARETGAEADDDVGVGGFHRSEEVGERRAPEPAEQRGPVPG